MRCQELREMIDSYLTGELLIETNHEVLRHLENCHACRAEIAARRELRTRVSSAVRNSSAMQINPAFAARLKTNLREAALQPTVWEKLKQGSIFNIKGLAFAAACLLLVSIAGAVWLKRSLPTGENALAENNQSNQSNQSSRVPQPAESPIGQAVEIAQREMAQTAIGDHKNCAVKFRLAEKPVTLTVAAAKFGHFYKDLDKAVASAIKKTPPRNDSEKIEFLEAHSCVFQGRRFAHVVLKYRGRVVSVLVTDSDLPLNGGETTINQSKSDQMSVANFRAASKAVFVVSDLSETDNLTVAQTVAPAVRSHIERAAA